MLDYVVDTDNLDKLSFGSTKRFYSIINQNCPKPETDCRFQYSNMDIAVSSA